MRIFNILLAASIVALTASTMAIAQKSPEKIRLHNGSKEGALLIRVPNQPFPYALQFSKNGKSGFGSRVYVMKVDPRSDGIQYIARTLSPGRYRLDTVWQQGAWSLCLEQGTFEVEISGGSISFVGTFHVDQLLREIQQSAVDAGRTTIFGSDYYLKRGVKTAPVISGREAVDLGEARTFAQSVMGGAADITHLAKVNDTAFSTSGFGKALKICG